MPQSSEVKVSLEAEPTPADAPKVEPKGIPEKFKGDLDAFAKSYYEMERKQSATVPTPEVTPVVTPVVTPEVKPALATDFDTYVKEYAKDKTLSPESYAALAAQGLSKKIVDDHITGRVAIAAEHDRRVLAAAGGREAWDTAVAWASKALSIPEQTAFNTMLAGDTAMAEIAAQSVVAKYRHANGLAGRELTATSGGGGGIVGFKNEAAFNDAIQDPRYSKSEEFRASVDARFAASPWALK